MLYKKFFIINGFIIFYFILWNYLIRVRLPKEISPDLANYIVYYYVTMFSVTILTLLVSILHVFNIHIFKSSKFTLVIKQSLEALDIFIKEHIEVVSNVLQEKMFIFLFSNQKVIKYVYILFSVLPKVIVTLCLCYDVFYSKNIYYFYKSFPLLILPLIAKYLLYSFKNLYEVQYNHINRRIDISCYSSGDNIYAERITLDFYIEQTIQIRHFNLNQPFDCLITLKPSFLAEVIHKYGSETVEFDHKKALVKFKNLAEHLIKLRTVAYIYEKYPRKYDLKFNIMLYVIATFCWGYTLFLCDLYSYPTQFYIPEDPFSGIYLI